MHRAALLALGLATLLPLTAQADTADQITAREGEFYRTFIEADINKMAEIFADGFLYQHGSGATFEEAQFLDFIASGTAVVTKADTPDLGIRDFGDTVVTYGASFVEGTIEGQPFGGNLRFVNVWHRQNENWYLHHRNSQFVN